MVCVYVLIEVRFIICFKKYLLVEKQINNPGTSLMLLMLKSTDGPIPTIQ
jgi:hypothetical protein